MFDAPARIRRLPESLINQIAAGEVVERPASVVKELLENSLDAGARRIEVLLEQGGLRSIRVKDDGWGIEPEDLSLALCRHATSKIGALQDLQGISSLGFRGEALPSIGSVSRLSLSSRVRGRDTAWMVRADGGEDVTDPEPTPCPEGTTVDVRDLFYNTPARRKFIRSERTEFLLVQQWIKRIALSRFDVGFRLEHERRPVLNLTGTVDEAGQRRRIRDVYGAAFTEASVEVDSTAADVRLWGWLGLPLLARSQSDLQYLYLNGRVIRDKTISHAVRRAYQDLIAEGKHPAYLLYVEIDPAVVDVNVHPAKSEVRFRDSRVVHDVIYSSIHRALTGAVITLRGSGDGQTPAYHRPTERSTHPNLRDRAGAYGPVSVVRSAEERRDGGTAHEYPLGAALGLVHDRYLIAKNRMGLLIVDLQSAVQHLIAERFGANRTGGVVASEPLLIPEIVRLTGTGVDVLLSQAPLLASFGLQLDGAGPQALLIRRIPALLRGADRACLIRDLVAGLERRSVHSTQAERHAAVLKVLAVHGSSGQATAPTPEAWNGLLRELESRVLSAGHGGHGIWRQFAAEELSRLISHPEGAGFALQSDVHGRA